MHGLKQVPSPTPSVCITTSTPIRAVLTFSLFNASPRNFFSFGLESLIPTTERASARTSCPAASASRVVSSPMPLLEPMISIRTRQPRSPHGGCRPAVSHAVLLYSTLQRPNWIVVIANEFKISGPIPPECPLSRPSRGFLTSNTRFLAAFQNAVELEGEPDHLDVQRHTPMVAHPDEDGRQRADERSRSIANNLVAVPRR